MDVYCNACGFAWDALEAGQCPRCASGDTEIIGWEQLGTKEEERLQKQLDFFHEMYGEGADDQSEID